VVVEGLGSLERDADVAETSVSIALWAVRVVCAWLTRSWFVGGGGGVVGVVTGTGVIESEDEEVELVCVWSCVDGPCCELFDSVELDEDV